MVQVTWPSPIKFAAFNLLKDQSKMVWDHSFTFDWFTPHLSNDNKNKNHSQSLEGHWYQLSDGRFQLKNLQSRRCSFRKKSTTKVRITNHSACRGQSLQWCCCVSPSSPLFDLKQKRWSNFSSEYLIYSLFISVRLEAQSLFLCYVWLSSSLIYFNQTGVKTCTSVNPSECNREKTVGNRRVQTYLSAVFGPWWPLCCRQSQTSRNLKRNWR